MAGNFALSTYQNSRQCRIHAVYQSLWFRQENKRIPLATLLGIVGIKCFLDRWGLCAGIDALCKMEAAVCSAPIGIFILSHTFLLHKWPARELTCFLDRKKDTQALEMVECRPE